MAKKVTPFKNEYMIDMAKLSKQPTNYTLNGILLPIEKINGNVVTDTPKMTKLFAERPAKRMIEQYPVLFPMTNRDARTVIEYIATDGHALITLFPNADVEIHDQDWQQHLTITAMEDLVKTYNKRKSAFDGIRGALQTLSKK
ncbi:MAG: hypothetical protein J5620_04080 [Alphaproteobacteria bacterium]|nr:hypothetical protein [Alphaproteobacteria bacterium]